MKLQERAINELVEKINRKEEVTFDMDYNIAGFKDIDPPNKWEEYRPPLLTQKMYTQILYANEFDWGDIWMKAHLCTYLQGGIVEYKKADDVVLMARIRYKYEKRSWSGLKFISTENDISLDN